MLFNIILYAVVAVMIFRIVRLNKRTKKSRLIIDAVNSINDEPLFIEKIDAIIADESNPEFQNKARVLKLWGKAFHGHFNGFDEVLESIDVPQLYKEQSGVVNIAENEDSFFYLYMAIPNLLEKAGRNDLRKALREKMSAYDEQMKDQLVKATGDALADYYDETGDRGAAFFQKVLDGDYAEYRYVKNLIGIYKSVMNAHLAKLYLNEGKMDEFEDCKQLLMDFNQTRVGSRWIEGLGLDAYLPKEEEAETEEHETETFEFTEEEDEENK